MTTMLASAPPRIRSAAIDQIHVTHCLHGEGRYQNAGFSVLGSSTDEMLHRFALDYPQYQLPAGMQCTNCVLQVVQFMSNHGLNNPGGCFYHHCAIVNISDNAPNQPDAGVPGDDAGTTPSGSAGGCCNANTTESSTAGVLGAGLLGLLVLRRRRR